MYAVIENDKIISLESRPKWFDSDMNPVSDEILLFNGYYKVVYDLQEYIPELQKLVIRHRDDWIIQEDCVVATYDVIDISIEDLKRNRQYDVTQKRWDVMVGGVTLPNGVIVNSSIEDQNRITSIVANASLVGLTDEDVVDFKASNGWASISIAQIKIIAGVIGQLVQTCYSVERGHFEAINELTTREDVLAYDINSNWPETSESEP